MKDLRLILALLLITVGLITAFAALRFLRAENEFFSNEHSDADIARPEIQPGTLLGERCAKPGVINCFGFDNPNALSYAWPEGTVCDDAFQGQTNEQFGRDRRGPGNAVAVVQNDRCMFPEIDRTTFHSGDGALKITIPSNSYADSGGHFTEVFQRNQHGNPVGTYIGPGSSLGNVFYFQFYQRFDENFLSTKFQCLSGECGGWKQAIWYGNPPDGNSAASLEVTMHDGFQRGVPQLYGQIGADYYGIQDVRGCIHNASGDYPEPPCIRYKANQWMEFTGRIEIRGESNEPASHVQLWVNGSLVIDNQNAKIHWAGDAGNGFGQFLLSPYHTNKDGAQVHPEGHTWYDDVIISTQPISMAEPVN